MESKLVQKGGVDIGHAAHVDGCRSVGDKAREERGDLFLSAEIVLAVKCHAAKRVRAQSQAIVAPLSERILEAAWEGDRAWPIVRWNVAA